MELIITDVTRFHDPDKVCVAGMNSRGKCIRPLDYFSIQECRRYTIFPGSVIKGEFSQRVNTEPPHTEDHDRKNIRFSRYTTLVEFFNLLNKDAKGSVEEGFNIDLSEDRKCIPPKYAPNISIITISVNPREIFLLQSDYGKRPLKISFVDNNNAEYKFMPFSDKYMYDKIYVNDIYENIQNTNKIIWKQKYSFLRIGLGRIFSIGGRTGYWKQVNGLYTFPQWVNGTRKHV